MTAVQRNTVIIDALTDVSGKTCRFRKDFDYCSDLSALKRQPSRHDHSDIARSEDHDPPARHYISHIHKILYDTCRKHSGRAAPRDRDGSARPLPASGCQYDGTSPETLQAFSAHGNHCFVFTDPDDLMPAQYLSACFHRLIYRSDGIFRPGQLLMIAYQAKSIMDTLIEYTSCRLIPLQDHDSAGSGLFRTYSSSKSSRSGSYDQNFTLFHHFTSPENNSPPVPL